MTETAQPVSASQLAQDNLYVATEVSRRLRFRYNWVPADEAYSYSLWGLLQAAQVYSPQAGLPFPAYALRKAMYLAIDQMRRERVLQRKVHAPDEAAPASRPRPRQFPLTIDMPDRYAAEREKACDLKETVLWILRRLPSRDRALLLMYYAEGMTLREIGMTMHLSEAAISIRRRALLTRLREAAANDVR